MDRLNIGDILIFRHKEDLWLRWGHAGIYLGPKIKGGDPNFALIFHIKSAYGKPSIDLYEFKPGIDEISVLRYKGENNFSLRVERVIPIIYNEIKKYNYSYLSTFYVLVLPCFLDLDINPNHGLICSTLVVLIFKMLLPDHFPLSPGCSPANLRRLGDLPEWIHFTIKGIDKTLIIKDVPYA